MRILTLLLLHFLCLSAANWDLKKWPATYTVYGAHDYDGLQYMATGDVNGDGKPDLLLGAPGADTSASRKYGYGAVYLFYGGNLQGTKDLKTDSAHFVVLGFKRDMYSLGQSLAVGDVNGDGKGDLILAAAVGSVGGRPRGQVSIIFGGDLRGIWDLETRLPDYWILAPYISMSAREVAAGDLNGDGIDDIVLSCPFGGGPNQTRDGAGDVYIVYGARNISGIRDLEIAAADVVIYGADPQDHLGYSSSSMWPVLYCGDVDGDGIDDLLASAWSGDGPNNSRMSCGEVYLFYGGTLPQVWDLYYRPASLTIYGQRSGAGLSSCTVGDINGDGYSDLLLANSAFSYQDTAYVFYGNSAGLRGIKDLANDTADLLILGMREYNDFMGTVNLFDINQDNKSELLLCATFGDGPNNARSSCGDVYLLWGGDLRGVRDLSANPPAWTFYGTTVSYHLGGGRLAGGNVTGSNHSEVILSGGSSSSGPPSDPRIGGGDIHVIDLSHHIAVHEDWPFLGQPPRFYASPNPARHVVVLTAIGLNGEKAELKIYNSSGQLVKTLEVATDHSSLSVRWNCTDVNRRAVPPGIYFCRLITSRYCRTAKVIVLE